MPSPHAKGSSGRAAARATPAAIPTEVSSAEDTTAGRPHSATMPERRAHSPQGRHLDDDEVGGLAPGHQAAGPRPCGSTRPPRRYVDPPAGQRDAQLDAAPPPRRRAAPRTRGRMPRGQRAPSPACATSQPPLASTRIRAPGPSRPGPRPRGNVVRQGLSALGDLDLRGRAALEAGEDAGHLLGGHGRHGRVHRDEVPPWSGPAGQADSTADASQREASTCVLEEGRTRPPGRALHEGGLADGHPAEAHPHGDGDHPEPGQENLEVGQRAVGAARFHGIIHTRSARPLSGRGRTGRRTRCPPGRRAPST